MSLEHLTAPESKEVCPGHGDGPVTGTQGQLENQPVPNLDGLSSEMMNHKQCIK